MNGLRLTGVSPLINSGHPMAPRLLTLQERRISGNPDMGVYEYMSGVGLNEQKIKKLSLSPNPAQDFIVVHALADENTEFHLFTALGQELKNSVRTGNQLDVSLLSARTVCA